MAGALLAQYLDFADEIELTTLYLELTRVRHTTVHLCAAHVSLVGGEADLSAARPAGKPSSVVLNNGVLGIRRTSFCFGMAPSIPWSDLLVALQHVPLTLI